MTGRTHALIGALSLGMLQTISGLATPDLLPLWMALAALGAWLPDLDASQSRIKHLSFAGISPFVPLSLSLHRAFGHRGLLHSIGGWGLATLLFLPLGFWWSAGVPLALSLGYASHILADGCTKSGVPLLYPRRTRYHLLPRRLRITTGSLAEDGVFVALAVLLLALLLSQLSLQTL